MLLVLGFGWIVSTASSFWGFVQGFRRLLLGSRGWKVRAVNCMANEWYEGLTCGGKEGRVCLCLCLRWGIGM